jgi:hypothetical protein
MKILVHILFFLFLSTQLFSQNTISLGIKTSFYNSNIHFYNNFFPQNIKTSSLNNFNLSFITEIKNRKNTGIRIEISKIKKGWIFDEENNINNNFYQSEFDFINIPFMMTTYFGNKKININFALGPFAEFMISENSDKIKLDFPDEPFYFNEERDNTFSYGLMAMGGLSFNLNKNHFQLLVSYQYNFDNVFDIDIKNQSIPDISNFNTLSFSLVYLHSFIKKQ